MRLFFDDINGVTSNDFRRFVAGSMTKISFTLARVLPLLNVQLRTHWAKRRRQQQDLAWEVAIAIGQRPQSPLDKARITIERWSTGVGDTDNITASAKPLMDILCVQSKIHPFGLGVIADDNPQVCELHVAGRKATRRSDHRTVVTIEPLA